jgi:hypothetical protein
MEQCSSHCRAKETRVINMGQRELSAAAQEAIEVADAQVNNFGLPTYTELLDLARHVERGDRNGLGALRPVARKLLGEFA